MNKYNKGIYDELDKIAAENAQELYEKNQSESQYKYKNHIHLLMNFQLFVMRIEKETGMKRKDIMKAVQGIVETVDGINEFEFDKEFQAMWNKGE